MLPAELVEKIGSSPDVAQFPFGIERAVVGELELELLEIVAAQRAGDFRVVADGVSAKRATKVADDEVEIFDGLTDVFECSGREFGLGRRRRIVGGSRWLRRGFRGRRRRGLRDVIGD